MRPLVFGSIAGFAFGVVDVMLMIPLNLPDKRTAMIGAFLSRFAIGFLIPLVKAPMAPCLNGVLVGLLISLPDAWFTKSYAPILIGGVLGGALIGWAAGRWVTPLYVPNPDQR